MLILYRRFMKERWGHAGTENHYNQTKANIEIIEIWDSNMKQIGFYGL